MKFLSRDHIIHELQESLETYIEKFGVENIGIFEEEGEDDRYYIGYTATKNGKTYHIHTPFRKNNSGELTPIENEWTIEPDDPEGNDLRGYEDLESAFREI
jgi:hypothetical protein